MEKFTGNESEQLSLFGDGVIDLAKLRSVRGSLLGPRRATNTVLAYAADWRHFTEWCAQAGRARLPASSDTLALYITWILADRCLKTTTAARRIAAIVSYHRDSKQPPPPTQEAREVIRSIKRDRAETPVGKSALMPPDLRKAARACDTRTTLGLRDRAILVLGFATGLRRSNIAQVQLSDITFERRGLAVFVPRSKTDQMGVGRIIGVWKGKRAATDPVRVLKAWIARRGRWAGPLFPRILAGEVTRAPIGANTVYTAVKRAVKIGGLDVAAYAPHSLRAGAITTAAEGGRSDQEIMDLSGHVTPSVMRKYIRHARVFAGRNPLAGAL